MKFGLKKEDKIVKTKIEQKEGVLLNVIREEERVDKTPRVVNIKSGEYYDIVIGRESIFGNPFIIGINGTREQVIEKFEEYLLLHSDLLNKVKTNLKGKVLACSCSPLKCHGDVLLKYANPEMFYKSKPKI